jgi:hypothetical protein
MLYLFLIALLLLPIVIIAGLAYAYKRLSRFYFLLLTISLIGTPLTAFKIYERDFMLSVVPDALKVSSISYSEEDSWGFGPGGNEAGFRQYQLPEQISKQITVSGIDFLKNMPPNKNQAKRDLRGVYSDWVETPIKPGERWKPNKETGRFSIYDYICAYGVCIDIKPTVVEEANSIINDSGSYYAYGRNGLIIVSPNKNMVLYLYNG